jgi:hypothetical protein
MSSSFRSEPAMRHRFRIVGRSLLFAAATLLTESALAAEVYYQPVVTLSAETDSNLDLDIGKQPETQGYIADLSTIIGIDTPDSTTTIRPRIVYREYPQDSGDDRLEGYLDFSSAYKSQRSNASISGSLQHLDEFNAEFTEALFNDINPVQPGADTGRTVVGSTRDTAIVSPKYVYSFSPTVGAGVSGQYQITTYSPSDDTSHLNFDYYQGRAFLNWDSTQRSQWAFGGFGSKFQTKDVFSEATGSGALVDLTTTWTPLLTSTAELLFQHTSIDTAIPTPFNTSVNKIAGSIDVAYKTELDRFRLIARHSISPSGGGGLYTVDRLQFQYDRTFTTRFSMTGAVVGIRTRGLTANLSEDDRNYAQAIIEAHYMLTRRFFLQGGYQYAWQKYQDNTDSAANNRVYIQIGYQGLGQQR